MKAICLLSGGIDSPVAAYMMGRQNVDIILLHMDNRPNADPSSADKVEELTKALENALGKKLELYLSPHGRNQTIISSKANRSFQCVLCKRLMLFTAQAVAERMGAEAIITGESLGQVASQTLPNMVAEQKGLKIPVLRPLIGLDKLEIESIGKQIGTYPISIKPSSPCTFVPERPTTGALQEDMEKEMAKLDMDEMIDFSAKNVRPFRAQSIPD